MISLRFYARALGCLSVLAAPLLTGCGGGGASGTSTVPTPSPFSATQYAYAGTFGPPVTDPSNSVSGMAVDGSNNVYLTVPGAKQVQEFKSDGTALIKFGTPGSGDGQFGTQGPFGSGGPFGVAVGATGTIYVADLINHRIEEFSAGGTYLSQFGTKNLLPSEVVVNIKGTVAVSGSQFIATSTGVEVTGPAQVYQFSSDGTFLAQAGTPGNGAGQVGSSNGLAVDAAGNMYVADAQNGRVEVFKADGTFLFQFGTPGKANGQFAGLGGLAMDGAGNIYAADTDNSRIEKFKSDGTYLTQIATSLGGNVAKMYYPTFLTVDGNGTVYASDYFHPVQVYHPTL